MAQFRLPLTIFLIGLQPTKGWYVNSHLETNSERKLSLFASFFRLAVDEDPRTREVTYAHSVTWAVSDLDHQEYYAASCIDPSAPDIILKELDRGTDSDPLTERAMRGVVRAGKLPPPAAQSAASHRSEISFMRRCDELPVYGIFPL